MLNIIAYTRYISLKIECLGTNQEIHHHGKAPQQFPDITQKWEMRLRRCWFLRCNRIKTFRWETINLRCI